MLSFDMINIIIFFVACVEQNEIATYSCGKMASHNCKVNFMKVPSYFMNLLTYITIVFYQFHAPSKLVHHSSKPTWHVTHLNFMMLDLYLEQLHETSKSSGSRISQPLNLSPSHFEFFAFFFHNIWLFVRAFTISPTFESISKRICVPTYNSLVLQQWYNYLVF